MGVVLADVARDGGADGRCSLRWFAPLIRPMFSRAVLREALAFGLPRVPHAAAQQVMAVGDKSILTLFASVQDIGVYSMARQLRPDPEAVPERLRVRLGAVLLRDDARAGCGDACSAS